MTEHTEQSNILLWFTESLASEDSDDYLLEKYKKQKEQKKIDNATYYKKNKQKINEYQKGVL
jgi:hypothetical protein